jgi:putative transposase
MELRRNTHHVFRIMYHFVWIPKYRHKVFSEPYRTVLKDIIEQIGYDYNIEIIELEIPVDHIHMVVCRAPRYKIHLDSIPPELLIHLSANLIDPIRGV